MENHILQLATMEKLLKKAGAPRVSEDAKEALRDVLEEKSEEIGKRAVELALHTSRKTVKALDIKLALRQPRD